MPWLPLLSCLQGYKIHKVANEMKEDKLQREQKKERENVL